MCHVLIIEDDALTALDIQAILEDEGATSFDIAVTADEAIRAARARPPQVITSDVELLEGTGPQAVAAIQAEQGEVPVIFITGSPEKCDACSPPAAVLDKPIRPISIVETFRLLAAA